MTNIYSGEVKCPYCGAPVSFRFDCGRGLLQTIICDNEDHEGCGETLAVRLKSVKVNFSVFELQEVGP